MLIVSDGKKLVNYIIGGLKIIVRGAFKIFLYVTIYVNLENKKYIESVNNRYILYYINAIAGV